MCACEYQCFLPLCRFSYICILHKRCRQCVRSLYVYNITGRNVSVVIVIRSEWHFDKCSDPIDQTDKLIRKLNFKWTFGSVSADFEAIFLNAALLGCVPPSNNVHHPQRCFTKQITNDLNISIADTKFAQVTSMKRRDARVQQKIHSF